MVFRRRVKFNVTNINRVPEEPGVYIIYTCGDGQPVYVGRSRGNIRARLRAHLSGRGNIWIKAILSGELGVELAFEFEWETMRSVEQAEAQLIKKLGTYNFFNLRRETDPADGD